MTGSEPPTEYTRKQKRAVMRYVTGVKRVQSDGNYTSLSRVFIDNRNNWGAGALIPSVPSQAL
jgi:hypothetical protein